MSRFDPTTVFPVFVLIIVIMGVYYANLSKQRFLNQAIAQSSPQPVATDIPSSPATPSSVTSSEHPAPTSMALINQKTSNTSLLTDLKYPNTSAKSTTATSMELTSQDSPNRITDWYKSKLKSLNLTTQTSTITNTNNNVLNILAAADNNAHVTIEIKKEAGNTTTSIKVTAQ